MTSFNDHQSNGRTHFFCFHHICSVQLDRVGLPGLCAGPQQRGVRRGDPEAPFSSSPPTLPPGEPLMKLGCCFLGLFADGFAGRCRTMSTPCSRSSPRRRRRNTSTRCGSPTRTTSHARSPSLSRRSSTQSRTSAPSSKTRRTTRHTRVSCSRRPQHGSRPSPTCTSALLS